MKKPLTDSLMITVESKRKSRRFLVPKIKAKGLASLIGEFEIDNDRITNVDHLFSDLNQKYTKPGAILKGARLKENISQRRLAEKLGISQHHISEMEHGKRAIGRQMSKRLSRILKVSYKIFL